ncbi:hypothetical protein Agabi119p4_760 [Agaricus bisporus var. burnettii]|uniref:Uncharacterized protein n=1 Tax=Agaricus bisporus var. burnettii TaxID=192524 RepID=A0A8H7FBH9_AGABI|nr:hypothetical protein Agabi119p4_760 [Agaricus bisporus var. burnettii]
MTSSVSPRRSGRKASSSSNSLPRSFCCRFLANGWVGSGATGHTLATSVWGSERLSSLAEYNISRTPTGVSPTRTSHLPVSPQYPTLLCSVNQPIKCTTSC